MDKTRQVRERHLGKCLWTFYTMFRHSTDQTTKRFIEKIITRVIDNNCLLQSWPELRYWTSRCAMTAQSPRTMIRFGTWRNPPCTKRLLYSCWHVKAEVHLPGKKPMELCQNVTVINHKTLLNTLHVKPLARFSKKKSDFKMLKEWVVEAANIQATVKNLSILLGAGVSLFNL